VGGRCKLEQEEESGVGRCARTCWVFLGTMAIGWLQHKSRWSVLKNTEWELEEGKCDEN
jgi:hypothetical protein